MTVKSRSQRINKRLFKKEFRAYLNKRAMGRGWLFSTACCACWFVVAVALSIAFGVTYRHTAAVETHDLDLSGRYQGMWKQYYPSDGTTVNLEPRHYHFTRNGSFIRYTYDEAPEVVNFGALSPTTGDVHEATLRNIQNGVASFEHWVIHDGGKRIESVYLGIFSAFVGTYTRL